MSFDIEGNWKAGWALDLHTIGSVRLEDGSFDNTYSDVGKALNRLKYSGEEENIEYLVAELVAFLRTRFVTPYIEVIVPAPASKQRDLQPVYAIAQAVAETLEIKYDQNYVEKVKDTAELKSIEDITERQQILSGAFKVDSRYESDKVLIIDDLFRSGSTLNELTKTMYNQGNVDNVYVVTLTKTRVHR
ncbi:ComF family protein [Vibrio tetraodonis]|uniref:ComF family protein n=1 Tax=Vibrio tetraodonis TaxID=2231647 RepID=UPI000E0B9F85|nr:ComF family protein [Vibrio tetraodonis]